MYTFCVLILPLALAFFFSQEKNKANILLLLTGFLTGILLFAVKEFFTFSHRMIYYSFKGNFSYLFFRETFLPMVILYLVFFFSSKDDLPFKIHGFFPLIASFYIIYLPYICVTSPESATAFEVFIKPVIFAAVIWGLGTTISIIYKSLLEKKNLGLLTALAIPVFLVMPAITETLFLMNFTPFSYFSLAFFTIILVLAIKFIDFKTN